MKGGVAVASSAEENESCQQAAENVKAGICVQ
jgi:hypothetical protein